MLKLKPSSHGIMLFDVFEQTYMYMLFSRIKVEYIVIIMIDIVYIVNTFLPLLHWPYKYISPIITAFNPLNQWWKNL
jgi:hypothetical protein